jgi:hypothetical protein
VEVVEEAVVSVTMLSVLGLLGLEMSVTIEPSP